MVATSHDVMPDIELYQPTDEANALDLANTLGSDPSVEGRGWLLGGGQDTYGWLKDRNKTPAAMIELTQIDAWKGIKEIGDGIEIGAVTTITEIANNPLVQSRSGLLAEAASKVASPQNRN
ncbi:MAG: FAD binding domain-containing protein, partial [Pseudomonadales bacterium]|nr:FAD binding domain-containing protein [Pseudomonadales bacterium]